MNMSMEHWWNDTDREAEVLEAELVPLPFISLV
jgi:hypothetical protein